MLPCLRLLCPQLIEAKRIDCARWASILRGKIIGKWARVIFRKSPSSLIRTPKKLKVEKKKTNTYIDTKAFNTLNNRVALSFFRP